MPIQWSLKTSVDVPGSLKSNGLCATILVHTIGH